ncbi:hypothetical protein ABK040_016173 [Willaertia magna]
MTRAEKRCFIRYLNSVINTRIKEGLVNDEGTKNWIDLSTENLDESTELYERLSDGVVFCHLIDNISPSTIDWKKINTVKTAGGELSKFQKLENHSAVIDTALAIGLKIIGISTEDCSEGKPSPIAAILWQLIRSDVTKRLNIVHCLKMIALKEENETLEDFMKLSSSATSMLIRWVNYQLTKGGYTDIMVHGFGDEWSNSIVFCRLLRCIASENFTEEKVNLILNTEDFKERATIFLETVEVLGLNKKNIILEPDDICQGTKTLIMAFVSSIASSCDYCLSNEFTESVSKMEELRLELIDNLVEVMSEDVPEIKKPEIKAFLSMIKNLSNVNIEEIETKIFKQRQLVENELKEEIVKLKSELVASQDKVNVMSKELLIHNQDNQKKEELISSTADMLKNHLEEAKESQLKLLSEIEILNQKIKELEEKNTFLQQKVELAEKERDGIKDILDIKLTKFDSGISGIKKDLHFTLNLLGDAGDLKLAEYYFGTLTMDSILKLSPTKSGYMEKVGRKKRNTLKRFFILTQGFLFYFANEKSDRPKGVLRVVDCEITNDPKTMNSFVIKTASRVMTCYALPPDSREEWIESIQKQTSTGFIQLLN